MNTEYFPTPHVNVSGLLLVNKPKGITSFDVIRILRSKTGLSKMGHGGVLDKNATGLLIVGVGKATKKLSILLEGSKKYTTTIVIGAGSDTHDWLGHRWVYKSVPKNITLSTIQELLSTSFTGTIQQKPPLYSALKKEGKKYYQYALSGESLEISAREVDIFSLRCVSYIQKSYQAQLVLSIECSKGTYIRSLARDIGLQLGSVGVVKDLCRTHIGNYSLANAIPLSRITSLEDIQKAVIS
ncbi:MAG: tRNA pseudouridine(55) synthase TruB [Caldisericia bacterium]|nr:tRNA pseudouridine(55) synthase TruB [Caldisericia bacterium]